MMVVHQSFIASGIAQNRRKVQRVPPRRFLASGPRPASVPVVHTRAAESADSLDIPKPRLFQRELDTQQDPALLTPRGQWFKLGEILMDALQTEGELPEQAILKIRYAVAPPLEKIKKKLEEMDQLAKSNNWRMKIARLKGFPHQVPPMLFDHDPNSITFKVNLSQADMPELHKFAKFLINNYKYMDASY